jgi:hypothetical protein
MKYEDRFVDWIIEDLWLYKKGVEGSARIWVDNGMLYLIATDRRTADAIASAMMQGYKLQKGYLRRPTKEEWEKLFLPHFRELMEG